MLASIAVPQLARLYTYYNTQALILRDSWKHFRPRQQAVRGRLVVSQKVWQTAAAMITPKTP
jgi:hypothetical protein